MNLLLLPLFFACTNAQVEVEVLIDHGPQAMEWVGWKEDAPILSEAVQAAGDGTPFWWTVTFPHEVQFPKDSWALELADGAWLPGEPVVGSPSPQWKLAGLPDGVDPMPLDTLWLLSVGRDRVPKTDGERDQLWSRTATGSLDRLQGYLIDWTPEGISFETSVKERLIQWDQLDALTVLAEETDPQTQAVWIQLINGGVLSARILSADASRLQLQLPWDATWSLPTNAIVRLIRRDGLEEWAGPGPNGAAAWSFDVLPQAEALDYTPRVGKSIEGRPLRPGAGSPVFPQGFGTMVPTTLSRQVDGPGTLLITVGVDQEVSTFRNPQPVRFQVLLDDTVQLDSGPLTWREGSRTFLVEVSTMGTLKLDCQPAELLPFSGHGDWCDLVWRRGIDES